MVFRGCPAVEDKVLVKKSCGSSDHRVDSNPSIITVKWKDNHVVQLTTNFVGIAPVDFIQCWERTENSIKIQIDILSNFQSMQQEYGGVDLTDMLIALYHAEVINKRWYI